MKQMILILSLCFVISEVYSQSLDEGKKNYYYRHYKKSESFFHSQLKQDINNAEAWYWLVKSYVAQGAIQNASDSLSLIPAALKTTPWYFLAESSLDLEKGEKEKSNAGITRALDLTRSKDPAILAEAGTIQVNSRNGDLNYGIDLLKQALRRDKKNAMYHLQIGNAYRKMQNGSEAYKAYEQALQLDNKLAEAFYQKGKIFLAQQNKELFIENFEKAIAADNNYSPAHFELYAYYAAVDPAKALSYFNEYRKHSDDPLADQYAYTDLLYLSRDYPKAIEEAKKLMASEGDSLKPRIYKLLAYSFQDSKDSATALAHMQSYFAKEADSNLIVKDFETMGTLFTSQHQLDSAMVYYEKAIPLIEDSTVLYGYYQKLAAYAKGVKDYHSEAKWLGKFYNNNSKATNVNLFNWGLAAFLAKEYSLADSVFGIYSSKYPEQSFGYYWRARTNAAIDTAMTAGLAVPHYEKLIEVIGEDSLTNTDKKWKIEAYGYLAAYETNTEKDFQEAIEYFEKLLEIDPENSQAKQYMTLLEKNLKKEKEGTQ